jgi:hypothetical protein
MRAAAGRMHAAAAKVRQSGAGLFWKSIYVSFGIAGA